MAVDGACSETTEELFDCVICGQASTSTEERPIGLVALLQPTAGKSGFSYCLCKIYPFQNSSKISEDLRRLPKISNSNKKIEDFEDQQFFQYSIRS